MKLNLCSGTDIKQDYINIDIRQLDPKIVVMDLEKELLKPFQSNSADEILALDCIEHISWRVIPQLLSDIYRVLKPGGVFIMRVPDLEEISRYTFLRPDFNDWLLMNYWIFGGQDYPENTHKAAFTKHLARHLLEMIGFKVEASYNEGTNMYVVARKK